jgi:tetratricopeptide (TPR) repeat protein
MIGDNGPFDEPGFCYQQGRLFAGGGNYRQAALEFARVRTLAPENLAARLWLAQLHILGRMPAEAIRIVQEIYGDAELLKLDRTNRVELAFVETSAHLANQDLAGAEIASQAAIQKYPGDTNYLAVCAQSFMNYGYYTNALALLEKQLRLNPDDASALVNQGYAFMQLNAYDSAIGPLSHALTIDKNNFSARLNRAIAYLRTDQLDKAQQDYETLRQIAPNLYQAYFGLGEIAYRKKDTNAALVNYQLYLTNAPPNLPEAQQVRDRIHELKPGSR